MNPTIILFYTIAYSSWDKGLLCLPWLGHFSRQKSRATLSSLILDDDATIIILLKKTISVCHQKDDSDRIVGYDAQVKHFQTEGNWKQGIWGYTCIGLQFKLL